MQLLIPAYFYPTDPSTGSPWAALSRANRGALIVNVADGPGSGPADTNYVAAIAGAQEGGWTVLGYVDAKYGAHPATSIESDIAAWDSLYGLKDVFVDQVWAEAAWTPQCPGPPGFAGTPSAWAAGLTDYVHDRGGATCFLNPGDTPHSSFLSRAVCDGIVVFEEPFTAFRPGANSWVPGMDYAVGKTVQPVPPNGLYYQCTVAGTSGPFPPPWPTTPGTVTESSLTWSYGEIGGSYYGGVVSSLPSYAESPVAIGMIVYDLPPQFMADVVRTCQALGVSYLDVTDNDRAANPYGALSGYFAAAERLVK